MAGWTLTAKAPMLEALGFAVSVRRNPALIPETDDSGRPALRIDHYRSGA
jgi:hypothetical protein